MRGAIDIHVHVDPDISETGAVDTIDIAKLRFARDQGIRGVVLKNKYGTSELLAYILRKEPPRRPTTTSGFARWVTAVRIRGMNSPTRPRDPTARF